MRVVVTGASGFLGGVVLRRLTEAGIDSLGVSRTEAPGLCQVASYADAPMGDVLIHLAETSDRARVNQMGLGYEQEVATTLRALLDKGYERVIYASSAVLYGDGSSTPHAETDAICASDTYTRTKLASEQAVLSTPRGNVARLANLFGPRMARVNVFSHILRQLDQDGPVLLQDTTPVRDFLWIEDAASAIQKIVATSENGLFNVGTGVGTSVWELAKTMLEVAGQPERQIISLKPAERHSCIVLDTTEITKRLDWRPSVTLQEGLWRIVNANTPSERK